MAMILTSDHREGGWEEQRRNTMMEPKRCSKRCNSTISREVGWEEQSRKRHKRCNSSIHNLTDDLLVEILQRLPSKSAFRCKSVSKRWFALISDHYFTRSFLHYHHTIKKWRPRKFIVNFYLKEFLITSQHPEVRFPLNLSFLPCFQTSQEEACVVLSSNDLLLCCAKQPYQSIYYVCNPLTKQWTVLPLSPISPKNNVSIGFISYPSYDTSECSFKVLCLTLYCHYRSEFIGEIFSSETGRWTTLSLSCRHGLFSDHISRLAIVYNGMFHWVLKAVHLKFFVYDPANDKTHAIDGPKGVRPDVILDFQADCLGLWRGRMRIAQLLVHNCSQYYKLKVWEYTTNTWRLMHNINLKELTWKNNSPLPKAKSTLPSALLAFHPYEDVMYLRFKDCVVSCNLQTKTLKFVSQLPYKGEGGPYRWGDVSTIVLPPWPTPVPVLPYDALLQ